MLQVEVHPEVYKELEQSRAWYENQAKRLGIEFLDEVDRAIDLIRKFPNTWSLYCEGCRRFLIHRFPFAIIFRNEKNKIRLFALMHLSRRSGYWKHRKF
ncbi:type II toxin-antitoxin system RelE/ParE family toxin [candidate division KSB1 bacterium]|nr:type II toxin-antitoxin system RelE/ParE family toxin [candidate division KSB1 bacterium]MBL7092582.1 type II toxin-antitoxin system RelE/ParE family toxin [candidate division KSB1 bacterium]